MKFVTYFLLLLSLNNTGMSQDTSTLWKSFEYQNLLDEHKSNGKPYLRFLNEPSLSMGLYMLKVGEKGDQKPHQLDEIYYIQAGAATLIAGEEEIEVNAGSILYVKAEIPHKFINITQDLEVLVIFSKSTFHKEDADWNAWDYNDFIETVEDNVWKQFADYSTLRMGLYLLPKKLNGDNTLTHKVDEINIVIKGESKFRMNHDEINVKPGSIMWVKEGVGHSFHNLSEDFEVLILFHKKS